MSPHALQMETALVEKADVKERRGPTSIRQGEDGEVDVVEEAPAAVLPVVPSTEACREKEKESKVGGEE